MSSKKTAPKKPPKPKPPTRDQLTAQLATAQTETRLVKEQLEIERRDARSTREALQKLRGIVAGLERKNALLTGYIERANQEQEPAEATLEQCGDVRASKVVSGPRFRFPSDTSGPAHVTEKDHNGYDRTGKAWYEL